MIKSKIHRAVVTDGNLNYNGSITIAKELMIAANILPFEYVHINNLSNAAHWETYAIPGEAGEIILNGPPSRLFQKDDRVVILSFSYLEDQLCRNFEHINVFVSETNKITDVVKNNNNDWTA